MHPAAPPLSALHAPSIQLQPVPLHLEPVPPRHRDLERLDLLAHELDDLPAARADQVIVVLLAVPVTKLYDKGTTMAPAALLESHTGESALTINPATGLKIGLSNGGQAKLKLNDLEMEAAVRFDETVSTGVVLVYRSFGIPISEPTTMQLLAVPQDSTISAAEKLRR